MASKADKFQKILAGDRRGGKIMFPPSCWMKRTIRGATLGDSLDVLCPGKPTGVHNQTETAILQQTPNQNPIPRECCSRNHYREVPFDCRARAQDETSANLDMGHDQYNESTTSRQNGIMAEHLFSAAKLIVG
jgi:hypothetical protein